MNGWTVARRSKQARAIHRWRPWEKSTGPRTQTGKSRVSQNAYRGGARQSLRASVRELNNLLRRKRDELDTFAKWDLEKAR
jgi:hypothetical protein